VVVVVVVFIDWQKYELEWIQHDPPISTGWSEVGEPTSNVILSAPSNANTFKKQLAL